MLQVSFVEVIDYLGTFAFAISGLRLASEKQFDLFGAFIVGFSTAVGGGTIRDVMIGVSPFWMTQWIYLFVVLLAVLAFLFLHKFISQIAQTIFLFDTIGLGLFTIVGFQKTYDAGFPFYACIIMGMCTGAAGGVIRDILINEVPLIFRRDIYAMACLVGGLFYTVAVIYGAPTIFAQSGCALVVILMRLFAVKYHWQLPLLHAYRFNRFNSQKMHTGPRNLNFYYHIGNSRKHH